MSVLEGLPSESFNDVEGKFVNSENPDLNNRTSELLTYFKGQKSFTNIKIADLAQIVNKVQK